MARTTWNGERGRMGQFVATCAGAVSCSVLVKLNYNRDRNFFVFFFVCPNLFILKIPIS